MAAGSWVLFDSFKERMGDNSIDIDDASAGAFKAMMLTSSYTPDLTDVFVSDLGAVEVDGTSNSYARVDLTNVVWVNTSGTLKWDCDDIAFAASGASIIAKYIALYYHTGSTADSDRQLVGYVDMNTAGASVTTEDGNTYVLQIDSAGVFTLT